MDKVPNVIAMIIGKYVGDPLQMSYVNRRCRILWKDTIRACITTFRFRCHYDTKNLADWASLTDFWSIIDELLNTDHIIRAGRVVEICMSKYPISIINSYYITDTMRQLISKYIPNEYIEQWVRRWLDGESYDMLEEFLNIRTEFRHGLQQISLIESIVDDVLITIRHRTMSQLDHVLNIYGRCFKLNQITAYEFVENYGIAMFNEAVNLGWLGHDEKNYTLGAYATRKVLFDMSRVLQKHKKWPIWLLSVTRSGPMGWLDT